MITATEDADLAPVTDERTAAADASATADARGSGRSRRMLVLSKPIATTVYTDTVPTSVPPGRVFVHDVAPQTRGGTVRYWHAPAGAPGLRACGCSLAPSLGIHFKAGR